MRFLFVDRILELVPGQITRGVKFITSDDYYLCTPQGELPYFVPSLIGETLGQLAAWNVMVCNDFSKRPVAGIVANAMVYRPVYVGETLLLESFIDALDEVAVRYHSVARVGEEVVFRIDNALGPLLPMQEFISEAMVRAQFSAINHSELSSSFNSSESKAPVQPMEPSLFMFDTLLDCNPGVNMVACKTIDGAAPYFPDHFPEKPVLPLTVLLEHKINLARLFLKQTEQFTCYEVSEMRRIKMKEFVVPGDTVHCTLHVKDQTKDTLILSVQSEVSGKRVCGLEMVMSTQGGV